MGRVLSTIAMIASLVLGGALATMSVEAKGDIDLTINVTASGYRTAEGLGDMKCAFGFPGLIEAPSLVILGEDDSEFVRELMGAGEVSKTKDVSYCIQTYEVSIPKAKQYTIQIAPYFTEDYTAEQVQVGELDIDIFRELGDPFPLPVRPEGGQIEDTDKYRIVGRVELLGEAGKEFLPGIVVGCWGLRGYEDVKAGAQLTILDQSGDIIAVTQLEPDPVSDGLDDCVFMFVAEVPEASFYTISTGRRGDVTYSFGDLEKVDWFVEMTLGK